MKEVPSDRKLPRRVALTGTALVAGALALSAAGCACQKEKDQIADLEAKIAELRNWEVRVESMYVGKDGKLKIKLNCMGDALQDTLCEYWKLGNYTVADTQNVAIVVGGATCSFEVPGHPPQEFVINALCAC